MSREDSLVVAFKTHLWNADIAVMADRLARAAAGARFVILADTSNGELTTAPHETIAHTSDFTGFGLPVFPADKVLWYNIDYPLYTLRRHFPAATHYIAAEYDVSVTLALAPLLRQAQRERLDLIGHYIHEAGPDWYWYDSVKPHFARPLQAYLPFMLVSARAVDHMLAARRAAYRGQTLENFADWPFCEAFIPSVIAALPDCRMAELQRFADTSHYTLDNARHLDDPEVTAPNRIAHPVMGVDAYERKRRIRGNIALGKPATQSSVSPWWNAASRAADARQGNNGRLGAAAGFNTAMEDHPWWQVDLEYNFNVDMINLFNRRDAPDKCRNLVIASSLDGAAWETRAQKTDDAPFGADGRPFTVSFSPPFEARFIRVTLLGTGELHLDEIEVYGTAAGFLRP